jgi:hypothetical protein
MKKGRDKLGCFKKGIYQGNGFKKGFHPRTEFKGGYHPPTEFKKGHKLCIGVDNPRYIDGRSFTRRGLEFPKSF